MSSKVAQQQQQQQQQTQGRRTPLSLSGAAAAAKGKDSPSIEQKSLRSSTDSAKESAAKSSPNETKKTQASQQNGEKKNNDQPAVELRSKRGDTQNEGKETAKNSKIPVSVESKDKKAELNGNEKPKRNEESKSSNDDKNNGVSNASSANQQQKADKRENRKSKSPSRADPKSDATTNNKSTAAKNSENGTANAAGDSPKVSPNKKSGTPVKAAGAKGKEKSSPVIVIDDGKTQTALKSSPVKPTRGNDVEIAPVKPAATSTPGKPSRSTRQTQAASAKSEISVSTTSGGSAGGSSTLDRSQIPRSFSQISGRRSIRSADSYTPSDTRGTKFRESYRRINTELDVTNTSMNATVGSEVPNNSSFSSFFSNIMGSNRKRERTPPTTSQSAMEIQTDTTPPKRARLDGLFSAVASPITMLRSRFSKTNLQCSTPNKNRGAEDADDVQNVSGISVEEIISNDNKENSGASKDVTLGEELKADADVAMEEKDALKDAKIDADGEVKITETLLVDGDLQAKSRRCNIM